MYHNIIILALSPESSKDTVTERLKTLVDSGILTLLAWLEA